MHRQMFIIPLFLRLNMINTLPALSRSLAILALAWIGFNTACGGIINGDFSTPLSDPNAGWRNEFSLGDPPVIEGGQGKFFDDGGFFQKQLEQTFSLPSDAGVLSFEYLLSSDWPGGPPPADVFQVNLLDPDFFSH